MVGVVDETGELYGFASWKVRNDVKLEGEDDPRSVIDIPIFAVSAPYQGETDHEGQKLARRFFRTLETLARQHPEATDEMEMHLVVDQRNDRGRAFWERMGFREVEVKEYPTITYVRMLRR